MDHTPGVGVGQGLGDLLEDAQVPLALIARIFAAVEKLGERLPLDELHREVGLFRPEKAQLVDRHHSRVLKLARDLRFFDKATRHVGVSLVAAEEDFERQVTSEIRIAGLVDRPDATARDLSHDLIPAG